MKLDSLNEETKIELHGLLYRSSCRSYWMLVVVLLLTFLSVAPLLKTLEGWVSGLLMLGLVIFSALVTFWPFVPLIEISKALPNSDLSDSAKKRIDRAGDRLADHIVPVVLMIFLFGIFLLRGLKAQ